MGPRQESMSSKKDARRVHAKNQAKKPSAALGAYTPPRRSVGRPRTWASPEAMLAAGNAYLDECQDAGEVLTIAGLALSLDLSYEGLNEYQDRPEYSAIVKKLKSRILQQCERKFYEAFPTGAIWHSKQLGFKDRSEVTNTGVPSNITEIHLPAKES
jgi:hypothetical protein